MNTTGKPTPEDHENDTVDSTTDEAIEDAEMITYTKIMGSKTGIFPAPEGAACLAAQVKLIESGWIKPDEKLVLFNTGAYAKVHLR